MYLDSLADSILWIGVVGLHCYGGAEALDDRLCRHGAA